jgi:hypothetical protein
MGFPPLPLTVSNPLREFGAADLEEIHGIGYLHDPIGITIAKIYSFKVICLELAQQNRKTNTVDKNPTQLALRNSELQ